MERKIQALARGGIAPMRNLHGGPSQERGRAERTERAEHRIERELRQERRRDARNARGAGTADRDIHGRQIDDRGRRERRQERRRRAAKVAAGRRPLPKTFQTDAQGRDVAKTVVEPLLGKRKGKPKVRTFRTITDGAGRRIPAVEQATAFRRRRERARGATRDAHTKAIKRGVGERAYLQASLKGKSGAAARERAQARVAKKAGMRYERKQRRLDEEAIARYGTHAGSTRVKGAERAHRREEERRRAAQPFLKRVKQDVGDMVKGAPASLKQTVEAYGQAVPGFPGYLKARAEGVSHAKAARRHAPKLHKLSAEFRESSPIVRAAKGDLEGAARAAKGRPVAAALEAGAVLSVAGRLTNAARPGGSAAARARSDKKILTPKRSKPRNARQARARLRRERLEAKHRARTGGKPRVRVAGDKQRQYARSPIVRGAQKAAEVAQAARGRDPSLMRPRQSDRRARKAFERGRDSERAGSLRREVEQAHKVKRAVGRATRGAGKAEREARGRMVAWLAAGHVRPGTVAQDLRALEREFTEELGAGSAEARAAARLVKKGDAAATPEIRKAAGELVSIGKDVERHLEDLGVIERGAAAGRAARQGPVARGSAVHVRAGDELPDSRDVPRSAHSHPGSPPRRPRVTVEEGRRRRQQAQETDARTRDLREQLAGVERELAGISPTRQRGRREKLPSSVTQALRARDRVREAHAAGKASKEQLKAAQRAYDDAYAAAKAAGEVRAVRDPKRVQAATKKRLDGDPAAVERVKFLRTELARLERRGYSVPDELYERRARLERQAKSTDGQERRAAKSELVEINREIRSYAKGSVDEARIAKVREELEQLDTETAGLLTRKKDLEMRLQHRDRPAQVRVTRERETAAKSRGERERAKHTGFVGEKQDPANVIGVRFRADESPERTTQPGQPVRRPGWTGEDVRRPDPKRDALQATLMENQRAVGQARVLQELEKFGSGITSGDEARRYAAAANQQGREFVVTNISPQLAARLAQREHLTAQDLKALLDDPGSDGVAMALPKTVLHSWEKGVTAPGSIASAGRVVTRQFLRATLPLSVMWQAGNLVDLTTRAAVGGAGPMSRQAFREWERTMRELDPHRADRITALMQGHFGSRRGVVAQPKVRDIFQRRRNGLESALHQLTSSLGDSSISRKTTAVPNAAIDAAFNFGARSEAKIVEAIMGRALIDGARELGMKQWQHVDLAKRMLKDDSLVEDFQRRTLELVGDYTKNPAARAFSPIDPFWSWFKASMRFTAYTLPVKHPVKAGLLAAAVTMTERERRLIGLSYLLTEQERKALHVPDPQEGFLAGGLQVGDRFIPTSPFTSFGTLAQLLPEGDQSGREQLLNPVAGLAGRLLPFAQDGIGVALGKRVAAGRLLGGMAAGKDTSSVGYRDHDPAASALKAFGEAFVPGAKQVRQSRDPRNAPGPLGNPAINPFAPRKPYVRAKARGDGIPKETKRVKPSGAITFTDDKGRKTKIGPRQTPPKYDTHYEAFGGTLRDELPDQVPVDVGAVINGGGATYDAGVIDLSGAAVAGGVSGPAPRVPANTDGGRGPSQAEQDLFERAADKYGLDPALLWGLEGAESGHTQGALSGAGAQGWMQFMPGTAAGMGVNPHDRRSAVFGAARYLSQYKGRGLEGMLRAYNAGPAGVDNPESRQHYANTLAGMKTWPGGGKRAQGGRHADVLAAGLPAPGKARKARKVTVAGASHQADRVSVALAFMRGELDAASFAAEISALADEPDTTYTIPGDTTRRGGKPQVTVRGKATRLVEPGGGWGGSAKVAETFAGWSGLTVTSRKRPYNTGSSVSDHFVGSRQAYAVDLGGSVAQMNRAFGLLAKRFGRRLTYNGYTNFTIRAKGGALFRVQVIYGPAVDHADHIHVGVKRVG
jgi:hypothetical protein